MAINRTPISDDDGSGQTGTILNNAWKQELYDQIDATPAGQQGNVALLNQANTFTQSQALYGVSPSLLLRDSAQPVDAELFSLTNAAQRLSFQVLNDANTVVLAEPLVLTRAGDVRVGRDLFEKGRAVPMGQPISCTLVGNSPTIVQEQASAYTLIGRTLILNSYMANTHITSASVSLQYQLPAGLLAATYGIGAAFINVNAAWEVGIAIVPNGGSLLTVHRNTLASFPVLSTLIVYVNCTVFIQ